MKPNLSRKYSVGRSIEELSVNSEGNNSESISLDDLSLSLNLSKRISNPMTNKQKHIVSFFNNNADFSHIASSMKPENLIHYSKYIKNENVKFLLSNLQKNKADSGLTKNYLRVLKTNLKDYFMIFLYLSIVLKFENDFNHLHWYYPSYDINVSGWDRSWALLNNRNFYINLLNSVFKNDENLVFDLLMEEIHEIEILYKRKIILMFLNYNKIDELRQVFDNKKNNLLKKSTNRYSLSIKNDALLKNFGKIFDLLLNHGFKKMIRTIFFKFEVRKHEIFREMVKYSTDKHLTIFYKLFSVTLVEKDFDMVVQFKRYRFIISLNKSSMQKILSSERRYRKIIGDFENCEYIDPIMFILYKTRNIVTNQQNMNFLYTRIEHVLELEYTHSPIFLSKNPLKLCLIIHTLFKVYNTRLRLNNEDFLRMSIKFLNICKEIIEYFPQNALDEYIFHIDEIKRRFLDYLFKSKASELLESRYINNSIRSFWIKNTNFNEHLIYFYNTKNVPKYIFLKGKRLTTYLRRFPRKDTYSVLKYSIFKDSLNYKIYNRILSVVLVLTLELIHVNYIDNLAITNKTLTNKTIIGLVISNRLALYIIIIFFRISYCFQIITQIYTHKNSKVEKNLYRIHNIIIFLFLVQSITNLNLSVDTYNNNRFLLVNFNNIPVYFLVIEIFLLMLPIPGVGKNLRLFLKLLQIVFLFSFLSLFPILVLGYFMNRLLVEYNSDFNIFNDIYKGILLIYEFAFGSVELEKVEIAPYNFVMNTLLIIISFFGNVMLLNILIAYLTSKFNYISNKALYYTSKTRYTYSKLYPNIKIDAIYYIPFNLFLLYLPLYILLNTKKNFRVINKIIKVTSHFILIVLPLCLFLFIANFYYAFIIYIKIMGKTISYLFKRPHIMILKLFLWVIIGFFVNLAIAFYDNVNVLRVISDYSTDDYKDENKDIIEQNEFRWKFLNEAKSKLENIDRNLKERYPYNYLIYHMIDLRPSNSYVDNIVDVSGEADEDNSVSDLRKQLSMQEVAKREKIKIEFYKEFLRGFALSNNKYVNIHFIEKYLKKNLSKENVNLIVNYELEELEYAIDAITHEEEEQLSEQIAKLNDKIDQLTEYIMQMKKN